MIYLFIFKSDMEKTRIKHTIKTANDFIHNKGGILKTTMYKNLTQPIEISCENNHAWKICIN